jgi:hypothetical protein
MRHLRLAAFVAAGLLATAGGRALAQGYLPQSPGNVGQITNPVYSPYLNLLRPGGNLAQNYFGLVRPELDLRNAAGTLQQQQYLNTQAISGLAYQNAAGYLPLVTGHAAGFLNLQGRFLSSRGGATGRGAGVGVGGGGIGAYGAGAGGLGAAPGLAAGYGGFPGAYGGGYGLGYGSPAAYGGGGGYGLGYGQPGAFGAGYGGLPLPGGYGGYPRY